MDCLNMYEVSRFPLISPSYVDFDYGFRLHNVFAR